MTRKRRVKKHNSRRSRIKALEEAGYQCFAFDENTEAQSTKEADHFSIVLTPTSRSPGGVFVQSWIFRFVCYENDRNGVSPIMGSFAPYARLYKHRNDPDKLNALKAAVLARAWDIVEELLA